MDSDSKRMLTYRMLNEYTAFLKREEKSRVTIEKYNRDIVKFIAFADGQNVTKELAISYKEKIKQEYEPASVNSMLAAVNGIFSFLGWLDCKVKRLSIQRRVFSEKYHELTKAEYMRLLHAASNPRQERIHLVTKTICGTGIRVSELRYITAQALRSGQAVVECKGKVRIVFIPKELLRQLRQYAKKHGIASGPIFVTRSGKPLNRSNIWREMKALCIAAHVDPAKVFPHNLRRLFARVFYELQKDIAKLADILGHSNIETTRVYILASSTVHSRQVERMRLVS